MKKIIVLVLLLTLIGCSNDQEKLYVLNWGDYIDYDLVTQFEEEFDVRVIYEDKRNKLRKESRSNEMKERKKEEMTKEENEREREREREKTYLYR